MHMYMSHAYRTSRYSNAIMGIVCVYYNINMVMQSWLEKHISPSFNKLFMYGTFSSTYMHIGMYRVQKTNIDSNAVVGIVSAYYNINM
jgi:hypothetical protein